MDPDQLFMELFSGEIRDISSSSDSSMDSDSSFDDLMRKTYQQKKMTKRRTRVEVIQDPLDCEELRPAEETTDNHDLGLSEEEFHNEFHVSIETARYLRDRIKQAKILPSHIFGRKKITAWKSALITLRYLAKKDSFKVNAETFQISTSTCWVIVRKIIDFFCSIREEFIVFPDAQSQPELADEISDAFSALYNIKGVVGFLGTTSIEIKSNNNVDYVNENNLYCVILQAVFDANKRVLDCFCGLPGSKDRLHVLERSYLYLRYLEDSNFLGQKFLLGSAGYPTFGWLFPPFTGHLTEQQISFNSKHNATRDVLTDGFQMLRQRFHRLTSFETSDIQFISRCVEAACVLHNICIWRTDHF